MSPTELKEFSEEKLQEVETKIDELIDKSDKTDAERDELKTLRGSQKELHRLKIAEIANDAKQAKHKLGELSNELTALKAKPAEPVKAAPKLLTDEIDVNGKKFYTDASLQSMIDSGRLTVEKANEHAKERDEESLYVKFQGRQRTEKAQESFIDEQKKDWEKVRAEYPQFDANHPKHDPEDQLY